MKQYHINLSLVKSPAEFYAVIKKSLELPDWFGDNLDAIWDLLTGYIETPATIYLSGGSLIPSPLKELYGKLITLFNELSNEDCAQNEFVIHIYD